MQKQTKMDAVRDFALDNPDLFFVSADPETDELFVAYNKLAMFGKFEGGVVARAVTKEGFKSAWQDFSNTMLMTMGTNEEKGAKLVNGVLDGLQAIGETLSTKKKPHGKSKKAGGKGGKGRTKIRIIRP